MRHADRRTVERSDASAGAAGRLGTAAAWIAAVCCLPYLVLKAVWAIGLPVAVTDRSVLEGKGWVAENALMAVIQLAGLLLVLVITRPWARRLPAWLLLGPAWVGTGLLFQVAVGAVLVALVPHPAAGSEETTAGMQPWVFVMVYAAFAVQGAALAVALAFYVRARWGELLGGLTREVVARTTRARTWPKRHLIALARAVAGTAAVVALVFGYWAAGGSAGLSGGQQGAPWALQASRAVGAGVAVVGLLCLAGDWAPRSRFWLPAALVWVGSGALAAFDGLNLTLNRLFFMTGAAPSDPGWSVTDTMLAIKVMIGLLAAAVGALVLATAATVVSRQSATRDTVSAPRMDR